MSKVNNCPPHHWYIDSENIGQCACGEIRDFNELLQRAGVFVAAGRRGAKASGGKRGRKKKEVSNG